MRIFALELNNEIKGIAEREAYIEELIASLPSPDLVVLPELALCSYMASQEMWKYADDRGSETERWATEMAQKYDTYIGVGYLDLDDGDYYNRYMIASKNGALGVVSKSEGESAVFKRGDFGSIIETPFGKVGIGICYDSRRKHFYDNVKDEALSLILFPHGAPADPKKPDYETATNDYFCGAYRDAFGVPVVYVNSVGHLEYMPGMMGKMMAEHGFRMNGKSKIYYTDGHDISSDVTEAIGLDTELRERKLSKEIPFYGKDIIKANFFFRVLILGPDTKHGIKLYETATKANNKKQSTKKEKTHE
jgi:predicted amidohydrolase